MGGGVEEGMGGGVEDGMGEGVEEGMGEGVEDAMPGALAVSPGGQQGGCAGSGRESGSVSPSQASIGSPAPATRTADHAPPEAVRPSMRPSVTVPVSRRTGEAPLPAASRAISIPSPLRIASRTPTGSAPATA
ncbi:MAG TPA: hypothetical protein VLL48_08655, partial [Longimicrobiales bacterium]|nr:hypothetical protein [Longimicrobiales bacterium]